MELALILLTTLMMGFLWVVSSEVKYLRQQYYMLYDIVCKQQERLLNKEEK
jgi:hypothetical protein